MKNFVNAVTVYKEINLKGERIAAFFEEESNDREVPRMMM